jgi:hypothetical protein
MKQLPTWLARVLRYFAVTFGPEAKPKKGHKPTQKTHRSVLVMFFSIFAVLLTAVLVGGGSLFVGTVSAAYRGGFEALLASLKEGNFLGLTWSRYVYDSYAGNIPLVAMDLSLWTTAFFHVLGFGLGASAWLSFLLLASGSSLLLFRRLHQSGASVVWKIVLPVLFSVALYLVYAFVSPEYFALVLYLPLFFLVVDLYFAKRRFAVVLFVVLLAMGQPTTSAVAGALYLLVFALDALKRNHPSASDYIAEVFRFVLYVAVGFALTLVLYFDPLIHVLHSTYGSAGLIREFSIFGKPILIYPPAQMGVSIGKLFVSSKTQNISGFLVYYHLTLWLVFAGVALTTAVSTVVRRWKTLFGSIQKLETLFESIYESPKKTFVAIGLIVFTILFGIQISIIILRNSFYNNFSDDIIQYYSIITDFIRHIKDGTLSWFNLNNYFGASFFSDVYYVPLDIFTYGTFLLSYLVPTELAYSIFELVKILAGVMTFAYYLHMVGMKNRTVFWMAMVYFISGGSVSFMAFPVFLSLVFYLPAALVVIQWFFRKKAWIVPPFVLALILYDFYLGYTVLAFMSFLFIIEYLKQPNFRLKKFLFQGAAFLGLILLGVAMSAAMLAPSILFILEDTYRPDGFFDAWVVELGPLTLKLFQPEIYIRILAKIFTEQKPIGFYGFENHYGQEHVSLYITMVGFLFMNVVFFMRGRISRVYKASIFVATVMMVFPLFSYVLSGTTDSPYTRWINMIPIVQTMILAHVFDRYGFETVKPKYLTAIAVVGLGLLAFVLQYYWKRLATDQNFISRDVLTADTYLMIFAGVTMVLVVVFVWIKRPSWIKRLFWIEFVVAIAYAYTGPFAIANKIDTFQSMRSIDRFLTESIDDDEFFRVYVDLFRFDVERLNFNRMTTFPTNTEIFHSWTDKETNEIGRLLYQVNEYQTKDRMNAQAIYLNHVLGYKYLLVDGTKNFPLDSDLFVLKNQNAQYKLYEIAHSEPFQVYESFITYQQFEQVSTSINRVATQKLLLLNVLLKEPIADAVLTETPVGSAPQIASLSPARTISEATLVQDVQNGTQYYRYSNEDFQIGFPVGAIYLRSTWLNPADYGRVYVEFNDGSQRECEVVADQTHQVKCEFWQEPTFIFFEKTERFNSVKTMQYRVEAAIDSAAYLVYDFPSHAFSAEEGMIFFQFSSGTKIERVFFTDDSGIVSEAFQGYHYYSGGKPKRMFVYKTNDMYKEPNLYFLSLRYIYDDLSDYAEHAPDRFAANQSLTIKNGTIRLSYDNVSTSGNDQIVMIPVAYSEEWIVQSGEHKTVSVSGGFLGILIPSGEEEINITLKFVPKGWQTGLLVSIGASLTYAGIFLIPHWIRRQKAKGGKPA